MSITCYDSNDAVINQLYQWDIDRKIHLVGDELTGVSEIHMTNKGQRRAVRVEYATARTGITVTVPNFLLRNTEPLVIYLYQEMGGTEERTVYELQIPIVRRAMPVGYMDSEAWSGSDRVFDTIDLDDYLLAQEDSLRGKITVLKVLELAGVDALADRVSTIEGKEAGWNAKYGADTVGGIPIDALSAETQLEIYAGRQAYDALEYKVDKVEGKGLSANDYDNAAKAKVDAIPANPQYTDTTYTAGTGISISDQNVISATGGGGSANAVLYTEQSLTAAQQAQARANMDAYSATDAAAAAQQVAAALASKQDDLTFDQTPTAGSDNPVTSGGVYDAIPTATSDLTNDSGFITGSDIPTIPSASDATPEALGTAAAGSSTSYSRADHVHEVPTAADVGAIAAPASPATGDTLVYNGSAWVAQNNAPKYTTLTLAAADWQSSGNAYSCSKTVTGMTATSIVWLSYSDTETEFSESQSANTLTFTVAELPSDAITVNVAFMEGSAL